MIARVGRRQVAAIVIFVFFLIILGLIVLSAGRRWWYLFQNPEELRTVVNSWGAWAPLGIIVLQLIQIVLAPLPGNVMAFAAGYALGFWPTIVYLMVGVLGGATIAFLIARLFGRWLLRFSVPAETLARFDAKVIRHGTFYIFLLLLVPNPMGDWVYYLAGLTGMPLPLFLILVLIARLPGNIIECGAGASAIRFGLRDWIVFGVVVVLLTVVYFLNQRRIEHLLARFTGIRS
ncbi:MAG: TVP38/TMEM64 family protein [bacterium]